MIRYTVAVDRNGEHPRVIVALDGDTIAERTIKTLGDCMNLGLLLTDPDTPPRRRGPNRLGVAAKTARRPQSPSAAGLKHTRLAIPQSPRPRKGSMSAFTNRVAIALTCIAAFSGALLTIAAGTADANCYSATGCTEAAKSARSFTQSVGVNTHLGYMDTQYNNAYGHVIKPRLLELGVSHIRDGTFPACWSSAPTIAARYNELGAAGIGLNLLVGEEQANGTGGSCTVQQRLDWLKANGLAKYTIGIEGENESMRSSDAIRAQQVDIWNRVKNDPALASKLVIGPSAGDGGDDWNWYNRVGDLSAYLDRGNLHPYPGEDPPHMRLGRDFSTAMEWAKITFGDKPVWATESGYWNKSPNDSHVSEQAAGVYIPRMTMEYFRRGVPRTQLYELIDLNTNTVDVIHNYGLLRTDGTRKPAFTALANLLAIVKDTASASGALGFGVVCTANCHSPIRHVLLRHSDGSYYLALWSESRVWNDADTPQPAQGIDLNLAESPARVDIYNTSSTAPFRSITDGSKKIATQVTDGVRLFKITPGAAPAPAPTAMSFEAEGMKITPWFPDHYPTPAIEQDDSTASAGKRLLFQHYGEGSQSITTTSKANRLTVRAFGVACSGAPQMTVKLNGTAVGTRTVPATSWADYTFTIDAAAATHTVVISYDNDYEDAACNRNLYLDKATFSYVVPDTAFEAEGMAVSQDYAWSSPTPGTVQDDATASAGKRLMLWTYGTASKTLTTEHAYSRVVVRAKGDQCDGAPEAWLKVDGATVAKHAVTATGWTDYSHTLRLPAGQHTISVQYPYDYESSACNRNLYLDRVVLAP